MGDDLVKQLRERAAHFVGHDAVRLREAADRIEADRAAMQQALEALECAYDGDMWPLKEQPAIASLRERLK